MKKKNTLKSVIGIAQEEIAIVLGITRSHCAMYATGKRSLPLQAKQELTKILQYVNEKRFTDKELQSFMKNEEQCMQEIFEKQIQLNEYKMLVLDKKIKKAERLRNESLVALRLAEYLDAQTDNKRTAGMSRVIKKQAMETIQRKNQLLGKYTISKKTLQQQSVLLEMELKNKAGISFLRDS